MKAGAGRPLRFLAAIVTGWTGMRVAILWYATGVPPALVPALVPFLAPSSAAPRVRLASPARAQPPVARVPSPVPHAPGAAAPRDPKLVLLALAGLSRFGRAQDHEAPPPPVLVSPVPAAAPPPLMAGRAPRPRSRWSGDVWLLARGGGSAGSAFGVGQLGGSQAGLRLAYAIGHARRVALVGRVDTPLHGTGREAAIGVEWRLRGNALRLVAEERVPLDGGQAAPAAGVIAGLNPTPVAAGFRLEAYGQAGAIDRGGVQGFADGAARLTHPLPRIGPFVPDLGAGAWGGAQQDAARLDIGPSLGMAFRLGKLPARVTLDWRQRIAGHARPGSGVALSLGADF
ncbi:MAG: hypothetical protein ACTHMG_09020 [Sphingomonas sp.]